MGRNNVPKFDEWRDGELYRFRKTPRSSISASPSLTITADDGAQVVYEVMRKGGMDAEVLAVCWADGLQGMLASFFDAGHRKGFEEGRRDAKSEIRKALND